MESPGGRNLASLYLETLIKERGRIDGRVLSLELRQKEIPLWLKLCNQWDKRQALFCELRREGGYTVIAGTHNIAESGIVLFYIFGVGGHPEGMRMCGQGIVMIPLDREEGERQATAKLFALVREVKEAMDDHDGQTEVIVEKVRRP